MNDALTQPRGSAFESLVAEWKALRTDDGSRSLRTVADTTAWQAAFEALVAEQLELRRQGRWLVGPVDLLSVVGRSRRETFHCAIVAWLMDPTAPHGLGVAFLSRLLNQCFPELEFKPHELAAATTRCEEVRPRSRADIVVRTPSCTVVFEAKVDAEERPCQCDDLYDDFGDEPDPRFVFLTPAGRPPETATGEALAAYRRLSFVQLWRALRAAVSEDPERLKRMRGYPAVATYLQTLEAEFS